MFTLAGFMHNTQNCLNFIVIFIHVKQNQHRQLHICTLTRVSLRNASTSTRSSGVNRCLNMKQIYNFNSNRSNSLCVGYSLCLTNLEIRICRNLKTCHDRLGCQGLLGLKTCRGMRRRTLLPVSTMNPLLRGT